jgi:dolichol-phosphate mannosyltransferase
VAYAAGLVCDGESWFKKFSAWFFYPLMRSLVYKRLPPDAGAFRLISRNCLDGLRQMRETHRFLRGMVAWVGYAQIAIPYERAARVASKSKYPLHKILAFAWTAATSFSILPLRIICEYIGKIYEQSKERPLYLVARTRNVESLKHQPASAPLSRSEYR